MRKLINNIAENLARAITGELPTETYIQRVRAVCSEYIRYYKRDLTGLPRKMQDIVLHSDITDYLEKHNIEAEPHLKRAMAHAFYFLTSEPNYSRYSATLNGHILETRELARVGIITESEAAEKNLLYLECMIISYLREGTRRETHRSRRFNPKEVVYS